MREMIKHQPALPAFPLPTPLTPFSSLPTPFAIDLENKSGVKGNFVLVRNMNGA
jgi:hypothetical protein